MLKVLKEDDDSDVFNPGFVSGEFLEDIIEPTDEPTVAKTPAPESLNYVNGTFTDKPQIPGQYERFPETVKFGPLTADIFDLKNKDDLTAYNTLLAKAYPEDAPEIVIQESVRNQDFVVLVIFKKLSYLIIN